jgi:hypothetical protein
MNEEIPAALPEVTFVGPQLDHDARYDAAQVIRKHAPDLTPAVETAKSAEQVRLIQSLGDAVFRYGWQLGVNLEQRYPRSSAVHLLTTENMEAIRDTIGNGDPLWGGAAIGSHVVAEVPDGDDRRALILVDALGHEIVHVAGSHKFTLTQDSDGDNHVNEASSGLSVAKTNAFSMFNELVTEETNRRVQRDFWPEYPLLKGYVDKYPDHEHIGYGADIHVGHALVEYAAQKLGRDPDELWADLSRALFTGDMRVMHQLKDVYGTEGMRALAEYTKPGGEQANALAFKLGLPISDKDVA